MASYANTSDIRQEEDTNENESGGENEDEDDGEEEEAKETSFSASAIAIKELCSFLISQACHVQAFKGRWISISSRLQRLSESLDSLKDEDEDEEQSILASLEEAKTLAQKSIDLSYGGKLLMQSNLDALATKLDMHLRVLEAHRTMLMDQSHRNGELNPKPNPKEQDYQKEQVRDLFTKLRLGNTELKKATLQALVQFLTDEDQKLSPLVVAQEGDLQRIVYLLDSSLHFIREKSVHVVAILAAADDPQCKKCLMSQPVLPPLVRILESGTPFAREKAARVLAELTPISENAHAIACYGAIPLLIKLCRNGTPSASISAANTLGNMARSEHIRHTLAEAGAVEAVIGLIASGSPQAHQHAVEALKNLALGRDEKILSKIVRHGGIQSLLMVLRHAPPPAVQETVLSILGDLSASSANAKTLVSAGFVPHLLDFIRSGSSTAQMLAALTMYNLSSYIEFNKQLHDAGCISSLTKMLEAKDTSQQEVAAQALSTLLLVNNNRKEFCKEEKGILHLVQLLDPRNQSIGKRFPISALMALSRSRTCRKRIMSAGAKPHLEKLAQMNVAGAKTTLDKIGDKSILSMIFKHRPS